MQKSKLFLHYLTFLHYFLAEFENNSDGGCGEQLLIQNKKSSQHLFHKTHILHYFASGSFQALGLRKLRPRA